jgi:antirestriction protein ArdC
MKAPGSGGRRNERRESRHDAQDRRRRRPVVVASSEGYEGINSVVMTLQRAARGYRTWSTFRTAILFFCGGLNL